MDLQQLHDIPGTVPDFAPAQIADCGASSEAETMRRADQVRSEHFAKVGHGLAAAWREASYEK